VVVIEFLSLGVPLKVNELYVLLLCCLVDVVEVEHRLTRCMFLLRPTPYNTRTCSSCHPC
jgi:hypothetical protein